MHILLVVHLRRPLVLCFWLLLEQLFLILYAVEVKLMPILKNFYIVCAAHDGSVRPGTLSSCTVGEKENVKCSSPLSESNQEKILNVACTLLHPTQ